MGQALRVLKKMKKVVFLDRDGTINVDTGYVHLVSQWQFTDRAIEALKMLQDATFTLVIPTGQSGIGRGMYDEAAMHALHKHTQTLLEEHRIHIAAIAFCPHHPDAGCQCRKPNPGMAQQIERTIGPIDYAKSWMIGDKLDDVGFGKAIGANTALIKSRYWNEDDITQQPDIIALSLYEAATQILES